MFSTEREMMMKSEFGLKVAPSVQNFQNQFHQLNDFTVQTWLRVAEQHLPYLQGVDRESVENGITAAAGVLRLRERNWE